MNQHRLLPRRHRLMLACWTIVYLSVALVFAIGSQQPPAERPADAPPDEFSSRRAFQHLEAIAAKPRPAGSAEIGLARDYLKRTLQAMDLQCTIQPGQITPRDGDAVELANVTARIKGSGAAGLKAVLLVAHYVSAQIHPALRTTARAR